MGGPTGVEHSLVGCCCCCWSVATRPSSQVTQASKNKLNTHELACTRWSKHASTTNKRASYGTCLDRAELQRRAAPVEGARAADGYWLGARECAAEWSGVAVAAVLVRGSDRMRAAAGCVTLAADTNKKCVLCEWILSGRTASLARRPPFFSLSLSPPSSSSSLWLAGLLFCLVFFSQPSSV